MGLNVNYEGCHMRLSLFCLPVAGMLKVLKYLTTAFGFCIFARFFKY